ncbi:CS1 type fimbrial major subunit [Streptomyces sp. H39-S7]|uniref:CS1 type fimbrial major subunit n=1 Tax=Streptomyces sp. H39-S7 TaxID=3004357 RepID=UPI0022AFF666|nr:CS1 type fimbrial major subunit [Streptomyces sp. H39-S7]MCZ4124157.1 CS1 type fimbrial major subunit [Streptomyces sp. H39-S7]
MVEIPNESPSDGQAADTGVPKLLVQDITPEQRGTLALTYSEDGMPTLTLSGGTAIPSGIRVVDETGTAVAVYAVSAVASEAPTAQTAPQTRSLTIYAGVDPTIELLQPDGSPLPASMEMAYLQGSGLRPTSLGTK